MTIELSLITFLAQLLIIFLLSKSFARNFFRFWFLLTKSKNWALKISALFLLPGTTVHELSHWLIAEILQVPTGEINLWPQHEKGMGFKMGSVKIAKTDPFRRTAIGLAPLFTGLLVITLTTSFLPQNWTDFQLILDFLFILLIFSIANTMFASKKDLAAAFVPFVILAIMVAAIWFFDISISEKITSPLLSLLDKLNVALLITIITNIVFLLLLTIITTIFSKILGRKVVGSQD